MLANFSGPLLLSKCAEGDESGESMEGGGCNASTLPFISYTAACSYVYSDSSLLWEKASVALAREHCSGWQRCGRGARDLEEHRYAASRVSRCEPGQRRREGAVAVSAAQRYRRCVRTPPAPPTSTPTQTSPTWSPSHTRRTPDEIVVAVHSDADSQLLLPPTAATHGSGENDSDASDDCGGAKAAAEALAMQQQHQQHRRSYTPLVAAGDIEPCPLLVLEPLLLVQGSAADPGVGGRRSQPRRRKEQLSPSEQQKVARIMIGYTLAFFLLAILTFYIVYFV